MIYEKNDMKRYGDAVMAVVEDARRKTYGGLFNCGPDELDEADKEFDRLVAEGLKKLEETL